MKNVLGNIPVKRTHSKTGRYSHTIKTSASVGYLTDRVDYEGWDTGLGRVGEVYSMRAFQSDGRDKFLNSLSILAKKKIVSLLYNC